MRLIFMGTPEFSVPVLDALLAAGHDVVCAYTQPPRPAGRGKKEQLTPVHARAAALGLPVRHPQNFRDAVAREDFAALNADAAIVVAYGLILPQAVLDAPRLGCFNVHASLLPRWRGAAPIQRAIMAGDQETGVCIMQMEAGLDTGPVLMRAALEIRPDDTAGSLHDRLSALGARLMVAALADLPPSEPQSGTGVTYATKIDKAEARIDWSRPAAEVDRQIRGLSPFPGAWTLIRGERVKLLLTETGEGTGLAGTALDDHLSIACGRDAVRLLRLQRAGKEAQDADEFLRGFPVEAGSTLG